MKLFTLLFTLLISFLAVGPALAQSEAEEQTVRLRLSRDFGSSLGGQIAGRFSYRVDAPDEIVRVEFLLDEQVIGEATERPFRFQFRTETYPQGVHTLQAIGYTAEGTAVASNLITREFVSGQSSNRILLFVTVGITLAVLASILITNWLSQRGYQKSDKPDYVGPYGGTVCPKCGKPFAIRLWALNLGLHKFDRCPHCGKWCVVRWQPTDVLEAAAKKTEETAVVPPPADSPETLRKRLDDSKFE